MVAVDDSTALTFSLSLGLSEDAPESRSLLENCGWEGASIIMDETYEGNDTRQLILDLGVTPVVPPKVNRLIPWEYDKEMYKNEMKLSVYFVA